MQAVRNLAGQLFVTVKKIFRNPKAGKPADPGVENKDSAQPVIKVISPAKKIKESLSDFTIL